MRLWSILVEGPDTLRIASCKGFTLEKEQSWLVLTVLCSDQTVASGREQCSSSNVPHVKPSCGVTTRLVKAMWYGVIRHGLSGGIRRSSLSIKSTVPVANQLESTREVTTEWSLERLPTLGPRESSMYYFNLTRMKQWLQRKRARAHFSNRVKNSIHCKLHWGVWWSGSWWFSDQL